jgi:hypothetical protein
MSDKEFILEEPEENAQSRWNRRFTSMQESNMFRKKITICGFSWKHEVEFKQREDNKM